MNANNWDNLTSAFRRDGIIHLNHAGVSPLPVVAQAGLNTAVEQMTIGGLQALEYTFGEVEACRTAIAERCLFDVEGLFLTQTCSKAISQVAFGMSYRPNQNIVVCDLEYPSNQYPWFEAARRAGCELRLIPSTTPGEFPTELFLSAIEQHTAVAAFSWVQYEAGAIAPVEQIVNKAKSYGARVCIDGIQGLGVLPQHFAEMGVDAVLGGSQKWMTGPIGLGFGWLSPTLREALSPLTLGAMSYGTPDDHAVYDKSLRSSPYRFEPGAPPMLAAIGLYGALKLWAEYPIKDVSKRALSFAQQLKEAFLENGFKVFGTNEICASPIVTGVSFSLDKTKRLEAALAELNVFFNKRAGGFRLAPHASSTQEEIKAVCEAIGNI